MVIVLMIKYFNKSSKNKRIYNIVYLIHKNKIEYNIEEYLIFFMYSLYF